MFKKSLPDKKSRQGLSILLNFLGYTGKSAQADKLMELKSKTTCFIKTGGCNYAVSVDG